MRYKDAVKEAVWIERMTNSLTYKEISDKLDLSIYKIKKILTERRHMEIKYALHDIFLYNCQGVIKSGIVVKIILIEGALYELDTGVTILEENVIAHLGNAKEIQEDFYETE